MTRRQKRYLRRQEQRAAKKAEILKENLTFDKVVDYSSLYDAAQKAANGVRWKSSVQQYFLNIFTHIVAAKKTLLKGKYIDMGFVEFDLCERGKMRHIRSVHFVVRVLEKSLCKNALHPVLGRSLITDNGASQKGKGTLFAQKRLVQQLRKYYKKYGNKGYILLLDFKGYFDNIEHPQLKAEVSKYFEDKRIINLHNHCVDAFGDKGIGLGSEVSQIDAITYVNSIDHYIKEKLQIKGYGRYMDDSYIIHPSKEVLQDILNKLKPKYEQLGIKLNPKKTCIADLRHGFLFLKTRFFLTDTGKILRKPCRDSITRERRKLKNQAKLYYKGLLPFNAIRQSFVSWAGPMKYRHARKTVYNMTKLLNQLFKKGEKNE